MTPEQRRKKFREWLESTYGAKQPREEFVADYNALAQAVDAKPINWAKVNHWMYDRQPPEKVGALKFQTVLDEIAKRRKWINERASQLTVDPEEAKRRAQGEAEATRVYTIALPVDRETEKAIERHASASGVTPEEWLRLRLEATVEKLNGGQR